MIQRPGPDLKPAHVWLAPAGADPRAAAHELLLCLAGSLLETEPVLRHDELGKPFVDPLAVSVSHGHDLVAVAACADGPVGIDVEQRRVFEVAGLANRWFHPEELAWMSAQPDEVEAFLQLWTAKEAVGKALGRGLRGAGLRRRMPLPITAAAAGNSSSSSLVAGWVEAEPGGRAGGEPHLAVVWVPVGADAVVAVALPVGTQTLEVWVHQGAALRRTVVSRTSFPVVVRGN